MTEFEWDPKKAESNVLKHGVHFADAVGVFTDDLAMTIEDTSTSEERFRTLGMDFLGRILVVVYAYRDETIRLISAREATARQKAIYEGTRR